MEQTSKTPANGESVDSLKEELPGSPDAAAKARRTKFLNRKVKFPLCSLGVQAIFIVLLAKFSDYPDEANTVLQTKCDLTRAASVVLTTTKNFTALGISLNVSEVPSSTPSPQCSYAAEENIYIFGSPYQDAQFFIVAGLTMLFLGTRHHSLSTMAFSIFIISICLQWAFLCRGFVRFTGHPHIIKPSPDVFVITVFFAAAVQISWGVILGRTSPMQLLLMSLIEIAVATANDYLILDVFRVNDPGGALIYNIFGTYFGLSVSKMLCNKRESPSEERRESTVYSETLAFIGSNILWGFWPTSMGAIYTKGRRYRCILNTYFALTGSGVVGTVLGALLDPEGKFTSCHVQNAVLAGAVAMSGSADTMMGVFGAVIVGCLAGSLSIITWMYIQPFLESRCNIVDICGSHTLHGVPAILGVLVSAVTASMATEKTYGESLYEIFPAMAPKADTAELERVHRIWPNVVAGEGRTALGQAGYQMVCMGTTLLIAITGGLVTGFLMRQNFFDPVEEEDFYNDAIWWNMPKGESRPQRRQQKLSPQHKAFVPSRPVDSPPSSWSHPAGSDNPAMTLDGEVSTSL